MSQVASEANASARHWRSTLIAVCIAQATAIVGFDFTLPFIPLYLQHDLGVHGVGNTALWAGLIGFGPAIPATIFGPIWGSIADRFGYRTMLLRATICAAVMLTLMGFVPSPQVLFGLRMVQGALTGTTFSAQALVAATVPERETGRSMGLLQMSVSVGAMMGPIGGGLAAELLGYRAAFVGAGLLLAASALVVYFFAHEPAKHAGHRLADAEEKPSMLAVLAVRPLLAALVLMLVAQLSATALFPIIPLFVQDLLGSAREVAADTGWIMAVSGLASAGGSYLAGRLQRRIGLRPLLTGAIAASAVLLLPQAFAGNFTSFLVLRAAAAFMFGGLFSLIGIWAAVSSPSSAKGTAFGLMGAASSMGFGAGPLLGGVLAAASGLRAVFIFSALSMGAVSAVMAAVCLALPVWRSYRLSLAAARER